MLRCTEPGWVLQVRDDPSGRRGIWTREGEDGRLELCSGREGDDSYLSLCPGQVLSTADLQALVTLLMGGRA